MEKVIIEKTENGYTATHSDDITIIFVDHVELNQLLFAYLNANGLEDWFDYNTHYPQLVESVKKGMPTMPAIESLLVENGYLIV